MARGSDTVAAAIDSVADQAFFARSWRSNIASHTSRPAAEENPSHGQ